MLLIGLHPLFPSPLAKHILAGSPLEKVTHAQHCHLAGLNNFFELLEWICLQISRAFSSGIGAVIKLSRS